MIPGLSNDTKVRMMNIPKKIRFMLYEGFTILNRENIEDIARVELQYTPRRHVLIPLELITPPLTRFAPMTLDRIAMDTKGLPILLGHSQINEMYAIWLDGPLDAPAPVRGYDGNVITEVLMGLSEDPAWPALLPMLPWSEG